MATKDGSSVICTLGCEYGGSNDDQNLGNEENLKKVSEAKNGKHGCIILQVEGVLRILNRYGAKRRRHEWMG